MSNKATYWHTIFDYHSFTPNSQGFIDFRDAPEPLYPKYDSYENVTFNIWLFKGEHHHIQCNRNLYTYSEIDIPFEFRANYYFLSPLLCGDRETYHALKKTYQDHDNVKFYVRALDCKLSQTTFRNMGTIGDHNTFREKCVDLENGDPKP